MPPRRKRPVEERVREVRNPHVHGIASTAFERSCPFVVSSSSSAPSGCGGGDRPRLAPVHGKITLDGKPLAGAGVRFAPADGGRESSAVTDEEGNYTLKYLRDDMGAKIGAHTVRISTANLHADRPDSVPEKYNVNSELRRDVVAGNNEFNFDLSTQ